MSASPDGSEAESSGEELHRELTTPLLTGYGVGTILGAGIFVVIGEVIGEAGILAPVAYVVAALVAVTTAASYAELGARVPTAGGPVDYTERAFGRRWVGSGIGWALLTAQVVSAATITTGFVDYLGVFFDVADAPIVLTLVGALTVLAVAGPKQSAWFMGITTSVGVVTLLAVVVATRDGLLAGPPEIAAALGSASWPDARGLFAAAFLAMYSFIGFGDMAMTAEETKDVKSTLPKAILTSLAIVFAFYLVVSLSVVGSVEVDRVAGAEAPLVEAAVAQGWPKWPVAIGSLFVIVNGALTQMITGSRLLYDLGRDGRGAPAIFGRVVDLTDTPVPATLAVALVVVILALLVPLKALAEATSFVILVVFAAVNAALVVLKRREQPDDVPNVPLAVPILGALFCVAALVGQALSRIIWG